MAAKKNKDKIDPSAFKRTLALLRPHLPKHAALIALGLFALLLDVVLRVLEPWPLKIAIDLISSELGASFPMPPILEALPWSHDLIATLLTIACALAVMIGLRAVVNFISTVAFAQVGARVATELRSRVFQHLQALSLKYHSRSSVGDNSQRMVGDVGRLQEVAVTAGLPLIANVATLVVLLIIMLILDPLLASVIVITCALFLLVSRSTTPKITNASRSTRKGEGKLVGSAAEALGAIRVVQSYGLEDVVASDFSDGNEKAMKAGVKAKRLAAQLERSTDLLIGFSQAIVLAVGSIQVVRGNLTPGDLTLFISYLKMSLRPLRQMAKFTGRIARASASGERIAELMDEIQEIRDPDNPVKLNEVRGDVAFNRIVATNGSGKLLYKRLDLNIPAGQHIALLGASGSGKSTLVSFLPRLRQPSSGSITIDGVDINDLSLAQLRENMTPLLQESVLFARSIRENIRFGRPDATDEEIEEAARRAGAHEFIMELKDGYETVLGQRGDTVSGGQRQRLAIARAMVRRAPIVILDEPTTGLDPESKAQVYAGIRELTKGRTAISITHDVSAVRDVDRVVWLENGVIVEDGSPQELAQDPESYFSRWIIEQEQDNA